MSSVLKFTRSDKSAIRTTGGYVSSYRLPTSNSQLPAPDAAGVDWHVQLAARRQAR